jgi:hypothetical protein
MKNQAIRTIYLYLFALVGLSMLVIGSSMLVNTGLKTFVFKNANLRENFIEKPMIMDRGESDLKVMKNLQNCGDECDLSDAEKEVVSAWLTDYDSWQQEISARDPEVYEKRDRARQTSSAISMILIGFPLWLIHWGFIKKDMKKNKEDK